MWATRRMSHSCDEAVQSHDILYKLSRHMVYTPAASEASAGVYWMAWKTMDVHQQRVRFVVAAFRREKPLGALCAEFGVSRPTGYRWLERYRAHGVEGIAEHSRRLIAVPLRRRSSATVSR